MKSIIAFLTISLFISTFAFGQFKGKLGHLNSNDLLELMPEKAAAEKSIQDYAKQMENQLLEMQTELEKKYNSYMAEKANLSEIVAKTKEEELMSMQQRIQTFQQSAQTELQKKEQDLLKPIIEKAQKAIADVSKENGYTYVFDTGVGTLLYWPKESDDLMPLVKVKLGIK
jgi:outer membrane protein